MKTLLSGIWALIWAIIVSILMFSIGTTYSFGYSIWKSITFKDPLAFLKFWVNLIDGYLAAIGHWFYETAYTLDIMWNVNGEILEDMLTHEEETTFGQKLLSVSASTGKLQLDGKLNKFGKGFSKVLNFAFNQKQHTIDAWNFTQARIALKHKFFEKK